MSLRVEKRQTQKMKTNGTTCNCTSPKNLLNIESLVQQAIPMIRFSSICYRMLNRVSEVGSKSTEKVTKSGNYDDQYSQMSYQARDLRKELIGLIDPSALFP